jgi:hypothetical protein
MFEETPKPTLANWAYKWENHAVYVSADGGQTWQLWMYFPPGGRKTARTRS